MASSVSRAGQLYDFAADHAEFYLDDLSKEFGWTRDQCAKAVRALRRILSGDVINLVCFQEGFGKPKRYELVGDVDKAGPWVAVRLRSLESQLDTIFAVAQSLENATDGRTTTGKKARLIRRHIGRLIEDFGELEGRLPGMSTANV